MIMANERWFLGDTVFVSEDGRSYGDITQGLEDGNGGDGVIGTPLPDDEDCAGFFFIGEDGYAHYYVIRRYGLAIAVDLVQELDLTHLNNYNIGAWPNIVKLAPGLLLAKYMPNHQYSFSKGGVAPTYFQIIKLTSTGAQVGPARAVTDDALSVSHWWDNPANVAYGGYYNGKVTCFYADGTGSYRDNRFKILGFSTYSINPTTLALTLDMPLQVAFDWDVDTAGGTSRTLEPHHTFHESNGRLAVIGITWATSNVADQDGNGGAEFQFDGTTITYVRDLSIPYTWATGIGVYTPRFTYSERMEREGFEGYTVFGGWGIGANKDYQPLGVIRTPPDPSETSYERNLYGESENPDDPPNLVEFPDEGTASIDNVNTQEAFDAVGAFKLESMDTDDATWEGDWSETATYGIPTTAQVYNSYAEFDVDGQLTLVGSQKFIMPFQTQSIVYVYAGLNSRYASGWGITHMGDDRVTVAAFTSKYPWAHLTNPEDTVLGPTAPFDKSFRVFQMFYKQGIDIPKLLIPRKRWAYPRRREVEDIMNKNSVPPEHRGVWLNGLEEWSMLRGMADEENYISIEQWVAQVRKDNGQDD